MDKTGRVAWDWWNDWGVYGVDFKVCINTETYKHYVDFASKNGIEYVVLDEGWYDPAKGDMLTIIDDIDLPELIRYGKEKNVDIILWTVAKVLDEQLEAANKKYAEMDAAGFKVDFSFLGDGSFKAVVFRDGVNTAKSAEDYLKEEVHVDKNTKMSIDMASGGGFLIKVEKPFGVRTPQRLRNNFH